MLVILRICPPKNSTLRSPTKGTAKLAANNLPYDLTIPTRDIDQLSLDWHPIKLDLGCSTFSSARNCLELFDSSAKSADEGSQNVTKLWSLHIPHVMIVRLSGLKSGCCKIHSPCFFLELSWNYLRSQITQWKLVGTHAVNVNIAYYITYTYKCNQCPQPTV